MSCMCFLKSPSYSTLFQNELLLPSSELLPPFKQVLHFPKWTWKCEALAWVGYSLWRWGSNLPCEVYYLRFLVFFQFGENTQWIMDDFALGTMCTVCVDIAHSLPKQHGFSARVISTCPEEKKHDDTAFKWACWASDQICKGTRDDCLMW